MTTALWVPRITEELRACDARATAVTAGLTAAQLNWKPRPGAWSVGQCIEHLCVTTEVYTPPIDAALAGGRMGPADEIRPGWFGRWFISSVIEPRPKPTRRRAPRKVKPGALVDERVIERFLEDNVLLRELIARAEGHDVNRIRFRNPFVPLIRFTVGTGFEILWRHQKRHLLQAETVRERMTEKSGIAR